MHRMARGAKASFLHLAGSPLPQARRRNDTGEELNERFARLGASGTVFVVSDSKVVSIAQGIEVVGGAAGVVIRAVLPMRQRTVGPEENILPPFSSNFAE